MRVSEHDRHLSIRIPDDHYRELRELAERQGRTVSDILRDCIAVVLSPESWEDDESAAVSTNRP